VNFSLGQYVAGSYNFSSNNYTIGFQQPLRIMLDTAVSIKGSLSICQGDTTVIYAAKAPFYTWFKNDSIINVKDTSYLKLTQNDTGVYRIAFTDGLGHFDSSRILVVTKSAYQKPFAPLITRDSTGFLISNYNSGNQWYKNGVAISGATDYKFKPTENATYSVNTTQNGCTSVNAISYYFLVTDIVNLNENQFIKLAPNPFVSKLYLNFFLIQYNTLNVDIIDLNTGRLITNRKMVNSGTNLNIEYISSGVYIIRVYSNDLKMTYTFKAVKL
jgi:hypothetical protein